MLQKPNGVRRPTVPQSKHAAAAPGAPTRQVFLLSLTEKGEFILFKKKGKGCVPPKTKKEKYMVSFKNIEFFNGLTGSCLTAICY